MQIFLQEFYKIKNPFLLGKDFIGLLFFFILHTSVLIQDYYTEHALLPL